MGLCLLVSIGFQVLFHSPPGVLFTFPSRYYSSIGHYVVFSLRRWSSRIPTGFLVSCGTPDTARLNSRFDYKAVTFFGSAFCLIRLHSFIPRRGPYPSPYFYDSVWALSLSLTTTQKIVRLLSFPPGT